MIKTRIQLVSGAIYLDVDAVSLSFLTPKGRIQILQDHASLDGVFILGDIVIVDTEHKKTIISIKSGGFMFANNIFDAVVSLLIDVKHQERVDTDEEVLFAEEEIYKERQISLDYCFP